MSECAAPPPVDAGLPADLPPEPWFHELQTWEFRLFLLVVAFWAAVVAASVFDPTITAWKQVWWGMGFPVAILGPAFLRGRRLALHDIIRQFLATDPPIQELYNLFVRRVEDDREPLIVGLLAGFAFLIFRVAASWEVFDTVYATWFMRLMLVFHPFGLGYTAATVWHLLRFGLFINQVSRELETRQRELFSWELLERMGRAYGRAAAGAAVLSLAFLVMVLTNLRFFSGELAGNLLQVLAMEAVCAVALGLPLAYLVIPQWRLHRILVERKREIRELFYARFLATEREFLQRPDRSLAQEYLANRQVIAEIDNLPEWPFRFQTLASVMSVFLVPLALFFLKEILVDVLVDLVKK